MIHSHFHRIVVSLSILCLSLLCSTTGSAAPQTLTIIGTGDLQGQLDAIPYHTVNNSKAKNMAVGGISRIAGLIKQTRKETTNPVIVVSSGDDLMGRYFQQFKGEAIFNLMEMAGYEILALGNHEFDKGPKLLAKALSSINLAPLCSDLAIENTAMAERCAPYLIRNYQGIRVGFFSLMTENFAKVTIGNEITIKEKHIDTARRMVAILQEQDAQVIIAVTHIGTDMDHRLAAQVDEIDIIFGGHSHDYQQNLTTINNCLILNGGEKGTALVRLDVGLDKNQRIIPQSAAYTLVPVNAAITPDPLVEKQLTTYRSQLPATTQVGRTEREWDLTSATLRRQESGVANLITDLIHQQFKVDAVLFNGGSFRGNATILPGIITDTMIAEIDGFKSNVYLLSIQGKYLQHIMEHSASLIGHGGFLQVSGLKCTINPKGKQGERVTILIQARGGSWQHLEQERYYHVASNDFLVQHGGDDYFWFKKYGCNISNTYSTMSSILTDAFHHQSIINPAQPDGRIRILP